MPRRRSVLFETVSLPSSEDGQKLLPPEPGDKDAIRRQLEKIRNELDTLEALL